MTTDAWTSIEDAFPPVGQPVLVSGGDDQPGQPGGEHAVARLADAWSASEAEGIPIAVWVDDQYGEELTFDPTHWRAIPTRRDDALRKAANRSDLRRIHRSATDAI